MIQKFRQWRLRRQLWLALIAMNTLWVFIVGLVLLITSPGILERVHPALIIVAGLGTIGLASVSAHRVIETLLMKRIDDLVSHLSSVDQPATSAPLPEPPYPDEIGKLSAAINSIATSYQTALARTNQKADAITALNLIAGLINQTLDLQEIFDVTLQALLAAIEWDAGAIYLWDEATATLDMVSYSGLPESMVRATIQERPGSGITGKAAQERKLLVVQNIPADSQYRTVSSSGWPSSQVSVPLITMTDDIVGVLNVNNFSERQPTSQELDFLTTVAHQIALATEKGQLYTRVSRHALELERIVEERTKQLAQAVDELQVALAGAQEAERIKSLLISIVSHELRTPLATIKGSTSVILDHYDDLTGELLQEHLRDIDEETDKLTYLISNLLEMSRIEAGILKVHPQTIDLGEVLRSAVSSAQLRLVGHAVQLTVPDSLPLCYGDARRIEQILANLVENAAKYSPVGTQINIQVEARTKELVVSVTDTGTGIPAEQLDRIFERFYQVSRGGDAGRHGIGLGLAICRGLVEAQGGGIWAESEVGEGSTFFFSLPQADSRTQDAEKVIWSAAE